MKRLRIAEGFTLPAEAAADAIAIVGRRGRGKTTTAVVLVEELHRAGERFVVADPVGVWWGLKSSRDGKGPGIPVVVMGGDHGDVPLEDTAGALIADFAADPANPSVVLDFRAFRKGQITRFATAFLEQLYHRNRAPLHVVLDEADQFAPQRVSGDVARMVGAAEDLCKMGRARGLHPVLITQRPAALNKNVLTQAGIMVAHGLTGPQDIKAVGEWITVRADADRKTEILSSLPGLLRGEAWVWAPEAEILRKAAIRDRETFDSSATPKGGVLRAPKVLAEVDLEGLRKRIAATIEKAKASDPRELGKTIADLRSQLAKKDAVLAEVDVRTKRIDDKLARVKARTVPVLKDAQVQRLETLSRRMEKAATVCAAAAAVVDAQANQIRSALAAARDAHEGPAHVRATAGGATPAAFAGGGGPGAVNGETARSSRPAPVVPRAARRGAADDLPDSDPAASRMGRAFLMALAHRGKDLEKRQILLLAGYRASGNTSTMFSALGKATYVEAPGPRTLRITPAGRAAIGDFTPLPRGNALRDQILAGSPRMEGEFLGVIFAAYPDSVTKAEILERTNYRASGNTSTVFSRINAMGYAVKTGPRQLRAADELFED